MASKLCAATASHVPTATDTPDLGDEPSSPLAIADYRRYWVARFMSVCASTGMVVVLGYQLYDIARSQYAMSIGEAAFQLGLFGLAQFLPLFLLTPLAGLAADRFDRRTVAALAMALDLVLALVLALATLYAKLSLPLLFAMGAGHGIVRVFMGPALSAIAPNIVPAPLMPRAIAISSMAWGSRMLSAPNAGMPSFLFP